MPVKNALVNFAMSIERGKIREFAVAIGSDDPAYFGLAPVIPPTFLTTAKFWEPNEEQLMPLLDFAYDRILHAGEEYIFHGPLPRAGDTLQVQARIDRTWQKEGKRGGVMHFALLVREYRDEAGTLVAEQRMTIVEVGQIPEEGA